MTKIKRFFNITSKKYVFDYNDIRSLLTFINVTLIIIFGLSVAPIGLAIAVFGFIRDMVVEERKLNSTIQHLCMIVLNLYFVTLMQFFSLSPMVEGAHELACPLLCAAGAHC